MRRWAPVAVGLSLLASCSAPGPAAPTIGPAVTVGQGVVTGLADGDVLRYRGLPYAAPPVGPLRWAPPQHPAAWTGTRDHTRPLPAALSSPPRPARPT